MLEQFTETARRAVSDADLEARRLEHGQVGTEHLLLALLSADDLGVAASLRAAGATLDAARAKVVEAVPASGPPPAGELPRTARGQRALERAARFARRDRRAVEPEHVLLGVLDVEGVACQVLRGLGVDVARLREGLTAAPIGSTPPAAPAAPPEPVVLRCPVCGDALGDALPGRHVEVRLGSGETRAAVVVGCPSCGVVLGTASP